ncbi:MAG: pantothenate kinase, partial [Arenimonas caeni]|nr:pantothenate kinase [Arenimonas caeni]
GEAHAFATDTADALAGGSLGAAVGLVERSHREATRLLGVAPAVLLGGGGAERLRELLEMDVVPAPALVLEGLAVYATQAGSDDE